MSKFWTGTLQPALQSVNDFINTNIKPTFDLLTGTALGNTIAKSGELSTFWTGTLQPALAAVGALISDVIQVAVDNFNASWSNMVGGFQALGGYVKDAISWLNKLADAIRGTPNMPSGGGGGEPPKFAKGVENFGGGLAYVHAGEILMNLRPGTSVIPADQSRQLLAPTIVNNNITNNLTFAPNYSSGGGVRMDYSFAKSLAGVA